ncbi:MAG: toll/interleukin-1 receptor domain-containing protein [Pyrinomonadaceae bacterium]
MEHLAFFSYARVDDEYSHGAISTFKSALQLKVREVTGDKSFKIFYDKEIEAGKKWKDKINGTLRDEALILIVAITPSFLRSKGCLEELSLFLERETKLKTTGLILPLYLVEASEIENDDNSNWIAQVLLQRQIVDCRQIYEDGLTDGSGRELIANLARQVKLVLESRTQELGDNQPPNFSPSAIRQTEAQTRAQSGPVTVVEDRMGHFAEEKTLLAERFGGYLLARLKRLCNDGQKVVLLVDSGTTLLPFFHVLGNYAIEARRAGPSTWIDKLTIVTNNLTGLDWLREHGRTSRDDRWSEIALQCMLLPGVPLATYGAVTGSNELSITQKFLRPLMPEELLAGLKASKTQLKSAEVVDLPRIIALVTGNWIRIRQTLPRYPIPLARGGHLSVKQSIIELADEVYVVASLGKIFAKGEKLEVEMTLNDLVDEQSPHQPQYREVDIDSPRYQVPGEEENAAQKIKLVTTFRTDDAILAELSKILGDQTFLGASIIGDDNYGTMKRSFVSEAGNNLMFKFDPQRDSLQAQLETEFPHANTRNSDFLRKFHVSEHLLDQLFP